MRYTFKRFSVFFSLAAFLAGSLPAAAGTTGSIKGIVVVSATGAPIAGAAITLSSPSQTTATTSDASGHFAVLSLAPDTYTISASKAGFSPTSLAGISIFADQSQDVRIVMQPALKTIATVTSRSSMDVVKPGTTSDVYSVNTTVTKAAAGLGGGGNLNNAYSAISTVPGAFVPPNQQGWDQVVYIRGGAPDQVGYEFDGVPVNRSFDNYPGGTAGTLGQQELQVYAGGGTSGESASGLAGFINQVTKTGTFPGYANVNVGIGTPTFYHSLQFEVGGATPDRLFSYYAGVGGYNQDYRYLNQFNGSSFGDVWGTPNIAYNTSNTFNIAGDYPTCVSTAPFGPFSKIGALPFYNGQNPSPTWDPFTLSPGQKGYIPLPSGASDPGCYNTITPAYASYSDIVDRETVFNVHIGIPHRHDSGRDDIQLLYNNDSLLSQFYSSANDIGPNLVSQLNQLNAFRYTNACQAGSSPSGQTLANYRGCSAAIASAPPEIWGDFITWPSGTSFGESAANVHAIPYFMPSSPGDRCANVPSGVPGACADGTFSAVPDDSRDSFWNNASIAKLQYQKNLGSSAYLRIYGYTFYSDWLQTSPLSYASGLYGFGVTSYDYELESHTRGLALQFADQMNPQNLVTFNANYTAATTNRYNNTAFNNTLTTSATNLIDNGNCIAYYTGPVNPGLPTGKLNPVYKAGSVAPCNSPLTSGTFGTPVEQAQCPASNPNCIPAGAQWDVTFTGNSGFVNTIDPNFYAFALEDKWNPTDRFDIDLGLRDEIYVFNLANTSNDGQDFWFTAGQKEFCYNPQTLAPYVIPAKPASGFPATPFIGFICPPGNVHPDGKDGHLLLSNQYSPTVTDSAFTPRIGVTYTASPDTVVRFSAGRYVQEPETYQVQYNAKDNNLAYDLFQAFWQYGFTTPRHDPLVQYSNNYDLSIEQRLKGTDISFKLTPYYRYATNQIYGIGLPFGLSGGLNTGIQRTDGIEFQMSKGDFNRNGLSFLLSYTYLNAAESYANFPGTTVNPIDPYNQDIENFNALTQGGGGAACYQNNSLTGQIVPLAPNCKAKYVSTSSNGWSPAIANPYYTMKEQPLFDRNAWYPVGLDYGYLTPNSLTAIVNYKHNRFSISPAFTFDEGALYGNPAAVAGIDPRTCTGLSIDPGIAHQADYTTCGAANTQNGTSAGTLFIPNPQTGTFPAFSQYRQPSQLNLSLNMAYDVSPRIKASVVLTNLLNACFGGSSEPWTAAYPPNSYTCGYVANGFYVANFYNGKSPNDVRANGVRLNPAFANSYTPAYADTNSLVLPGPFNMFVQFNIKV